MSKKNNEQKTNVMRILDSKKVKYSSFSFDSEKFTTGEEIAFALNENPNQVFKTLVTTGSSLVHYVFVVPVNQELDLKKAASSVGEKSVEMLKQKDLFLLTGYIHGGCSPIGMKKLFKTVIDDSAKNFDSIIFSAGKVGHQVQVLLDDIEKVIPVLFCDLKK